MRRMAVLTAAMIALSATMVQARPTPELRPFVGAYIPTGDQSHVLTGSASIGVQLAVEIHDNIHLVGTLAYATPGARRSTIGQDVHIHQYDVGAELFRTVPVSSDPRVTVRPFVGAGFGTRTHDFFDRDDTPAQTYLAGYGALGAEIQREQMALRLEVRDYVTRFKGLLGGEPARARNDLMVGAGVVFHIWPPGTRTRR